MVEESWWKGAEATRNQSRETGLMKDGQDAALPLKGKGRTPYLGLSEVTYPTALLPSPPPPPNFQLGQLADSAEQEERPQQLAQ